MGFLGALGKIGKTVGKGAFGLMTGGPMGAIQGVSEALSGGAAASRTGRIGEAALQAQMNAANNRASLDAAQFNRGTERDLMRRALSAKMIGGMSGPRDPRDRFGGGEVSPELQEMLSRYGGMADQDVMSGGYKQTPTLSSIPKSGFMEKLGGAAGTVGGILGSLRTLRRPGGSAGMSAQVGGMIPGATQGLEAFGMPRGVEEDVLERYGVFGSPADKQRYALGGGGALDPVSAALYQQFGLGAGRTNLEQFPSDRGPVNPRLGARF